MPAGPLGYLTVWPAGQNQPGVSTTNSPDGRVKANAAIVGAGSNGAVSVFASNTTNLVLDIDGYFAPIAGSTLAFYPLTPCRVVDTRTAPGPLGGPSLQGQVERDFPVLMSTCNLPTTAQAFSFNYTAVPPAPLGYLTTWATGQQQPTTSTLNSVTGTVVANAALVEPGMLAGNPGYVAVFPSNDTDLVIDVNGYFAPPASAPGGLSLFTLAPCRVLDTRLTTGAFSGTQSVNVVGSSCAIGDNLPTLAQALVTNATVVPQVPLGYLTLWPNGKAQPNASTLNAVDGAVTSNMAVVPTTNGFVNAFASNSTQLVVDLFDYFAIPGGLNGNYTFTIDGYVGSSTKAAGGRSGTPQSPPGPCPNPGPFMMVGSFIADGNSKVSGVFDLNCAGLGMIQPLNVAFNGTYSIQPNGLGTITITPTLNAPFDLSIAISSTGNGRLVLNNESSSYLQNSWGTGAISVQNPAALSLQQIAGSFASGFSGVDSSLNRYAGAGLYLINSTGGISGSASTNDNGVPGSTLTSGMLLGPDPNTGRGTATLVTSGVLTHSSFYVTSANELTFLSTDPITSPANLLLQTMLRQATLPFDNSYLNGASVIRTSGLSQSDKQKRRLQGGGTTDVVLGLFMASGNGNASVSLDENNGGTLTQQQMSAGHLQCRCERRSDSERLWQRHSSHFLSRGQERSVRPRPGQLGCFRFPGTARGAPFSNVSANGNVLGRQLHAGHCERDGFGHLGVCRRQRQPERDEHHQRPKRGWWRALQRHLLG